MFLLAVSFFSQRYSLNNIKSKTVGDGQHGTARWATPKEIRSTYHVVPFRPRRWRKGIDLPKEQGVRPQYFASNINDIIVPKEVFDKAQTLRKERNVLQGQVHSKMSRRMRCSCGSRIRAKRIHSLWYWVCYRHDEERTCSLMPIQEMQVEQAFLRLYFKLKHHGAEILTQLISDLRTARSGGLLWSEDIVELNKQISDIASQERLLAQLKQQGVVDPDIFISRSNLLAERRRELKLQKERILRAEEDHTIQKTQEMLDVLESGPDWLEALDEELFSELVESIIVVDNENLRFGLINGLAVTEPIERTKR